MADKSTSKHHPKTTPELARELLAAFNYQNATISEAEMVARHASLNATKEEAGKAIEWLKSEQVVEAADEAGRLRLTPPGRSVWRDAMGHA